MGFRFFIRFVILGNKNMSIIRNITPAVAVMVAGLAGAYLVYDNFFTAQNGAEFAAIAPAAGESTEDAIIIAEAGAPVTEATVAVETTPVAETTEVSTDGTVTKTETDVVTTTTEIAPAPVPAPNCDTLQAAATAAMGTAGADKAQKELSECLAAKATVKANGAADAAAVATDAAAAADDAAKTAADAATNADAAATEAKDAAKSATEAVKEAAPAATEAAPATETHEGHAH